MTEKSNSKNDALAELRKELDRIDDELIETAARRLGVVERIKDVKTREKIPLFNRQREGEVLEGYMLDDHVQILILIPSKFSKSKMIGYIKGKIAIYIARNYLSHRRNFTG